MCDVNQVVHPDQLLTLRATYRRRWGSPR
jgi:hypothetical protein